MSDFEYLEPRAAPAPAREGAAFQSGALDGPACARAGRELRRRGLFHAAAQYYAQAVGLAEHNHDLRAAWIDTLVRAGRIDEAGAQSRDAFEAYRKVRILYAARALALLHAGSLEAARPLLDVALEDDTARWYAMSVEAEWTLRARPERPQQAVFAFQRAAEAAADPWDVHYIGGWSLMRAERPVLAAAFFAEAVRADPRAAAGLMGLGDAFRALRLSDQAVFYYERALEAAPDQTAAQEAIAQCKSRVFGLMRAFGRRGLHETWRKEYEKLKQTVEWTDHAL